MYFSLKEKKNDYISGENPPKTTFVNGLTEGLKEHACKKSGCISRKRRELSYKFHRIRVKRVRLAITLP